MTTANSKNSRIAAIGDRLTAVTQWLLPTRLLSHGMHRLAGSQQTWLKNSLIGLFQQMHSVDLSEAETSNARDFSSFNAFFTRGLRTGMRPLPDRHNAIASPVDGSVGAFGDITAGRLYQAKGSVYNLTDLLNGSDMAAPFSSGTYATLYLAPHNYHRVHMPIDGTLRETRYVPGRLFGVNPTSVRAIPRLFTRNERLVCLFDTAIGPMAMVMVSAFCVGGIETVWSGTVSPPHRSQGNGTQFPTDGSDSIQLQRGQEMGRFNLGSTVILLFGDNALEWTDSAADDTEIRLGECLAHIPENREPTT